MSIWASSNHHEVKGYMKDSPKLNAFYALPEKNKCSFFFFAEHAMTRNSLLGHEGEIARANYGSTGFRRHAFLKRRSDPSFPQGSDGRLKSHVSVEIDWQEHACNLATSFALPYSP
jgi:hypothetical protein